MGLPSEERAARRVEWRVYCYVGSDFSWAPGQSSVLPSSVADACCWWFLWGAAGGLGSDSQPPGSTALQGAWNPVRVLTCKGLSVEGLTIAWGFQAVLGDSQVLDSGCELRKTNDPWLVDCWYSPSVPT